jgi:hypothetical protein
MLGKNRLKLLFILFWIRCGDKIEPVKFHFCDKVLEISKLFDESDSDGLLKNYFFLISATCHCILECHLSLDPQNSLEFEVSSKNGCSVNCPPP